MPKHLNMTPNAEGVYIYSPDRENAKQHRYYEWYSGPYSGFDFKPYQRDYFEALIKEANPLHVNSRCSLKAETLVGLGGGAENSKKNKNQTSRIIIDDLQFGVDMGSKQMAAYTTFLAGSGMKILDTYVVEPPLTVEAPRNRKERRMRQAERRRK